MVCNKAGQRAAANGGPGRMAPVAGCHARAATRQRIARVHRRAGRAPGAWAPVCARADRLQKLSLLHHCVKEQHTDAELFLVSGML